jgi:hypothetical protein
LVVDEEKKSTMLLFFSVREEDKVTFAFQDRHYLIYSREFLPARTDE